MTRRITGPLNTAHTQNTDTGTDSATFQVGASGPKVKNNSGVLEARNAADDAYADFKTKDFTGVGGTFTGAVTAGTKIINQPATDTLTVAEIMGTVITNYGQAEANTQTLPSTADVITAVGSGVEVAFIAQIRTAGAGAFHLKANGSDKHYFDDGSGTVTALTDGDKVSIATPAVGDTLVVMMIQTGAEAWDWLTTCTRGTATDGGA